MTGIIDLVRSLNRMALGVGLAAAIGAGAPLVASAQDGRSPQVEPGHRGRHGGPGQRLGRLAQELGLSPAQQAEMRSVMSRAREERRGLRELPQSERRDRMREIHTRVRGEMDGILTPEQQQRARQLREQRREGRAGHRLERMSERLGLTPAQQAQVQTIQQRAQAERERILQQTEAGSEARREAMRAQHARTREAMRAVLTPEQQGQMGHGHRRGGRRGR